MAYPSRSLCILSPRQCLLALAFLLDFMWLPAWRTYYQKPHSWSTEQQTSLPAIFSICFFSRLPLTAVVNEQPSHTCLLFPDYEVTCNPSSIWYSLLSCLQYTKFINCKKCLRAISYGSICPHPDARPLAMEHNTAYCDCRQSSSVSTKPWRKATAKKEPYWLYAHKA